MIFRFYEDDISARKNNRSAGWHWWCTECDIVINPDDHICVGDAC